MTYYTPSEYRDTSSHYWGRQHTRETKSLHKPTKIMKLCRKLNMNARNVMFYNGYFMKFRGQLGRYSFTTQNKPDIDIPLLHHYKLLNINENASMDEIKKSYNILLKQWHPDLYMSKSTKEQEMAQKKFMEIRDAYDIITNYKNNPELQKPSAKNVKSTSTSTSNNESSTFYSYSDVNESETESMDNEKYSVKIKYNQTVIHKLFSGIKTIFYDYWFHNSSYMRLVINTLLTVTIARFIYKGYIRPNINDVDPDRIWVYKKNTSNDNVTDEFKQYQPTSANASSYFPNFKKLQPHFKGETIYSDKLDSLDKLHQQNRPNYMLQKNEQQFMKREIISNKNDNNNLEIIGIDMNTGKRIKYHTKSQSKKVGINDIPTELKETPLSTLINSYSNINQNGSTKPVGSSKQKLEDLI